jgi:hypothetical protein
MSDGNNEDDEYSNEMVGINHINDEINNDSVDLIEYFYPGLACLNNSNIDLSNEDLENATFHVCTYQVNTSEKNPFLQFVLRKYSSNSSTNPDLLTFPSFEINGNEYVRDMSQIIEEAICATFKIIPANYDYKGFIKDNNNNYYIFYELPQNSIGVHDLYRSNDLWLVLMDEILNHNSCCNFSIDNVVSYFFMNNLEFSNLKNKKTMDYIESPIVGYVGCSYRLLNFTSCFGVSPTENSVLKKPYYYFTDYKNAIKMVETHDVDNNKKNGIVRFSIFPGYTGTLINQTDEELEDYDSVYVGNSVDSPLWGLKKYEQQIPLTCHFIGKNISENQFIL